jgi:hypothetical protein
MSGSRDPQLDWPVRRPTGLSEAELFQGYSGLAEVRRPMFVTAETVRARLAAAYGPLAADGVASRADVAAPDGDAAEALER